MFVRIGFALVIVAVLVGSVARTSSGAGHERVYVVQAGDTLWAIAAERYAGDPREGVWKLRRRNGLHGTLLRPGERLVLP